MREKGGGHQRRGSDANDSNCSNSTFTRAWQREPWDGQRQRDQQRRTPRRSAPDRTCILTRRCGPERVCNVCVLCVCAGGGGINSAHPVPSELGPRCWPPRQHAGQHVISPHLAGHGVTRQMQSPKHARGWCPPPPPSLPCCTRTPPQPPPPTTRTTTPTTTTTTTFSADVSWQLPLVCPRGTMKPGHIHSGGGCHVEIEVHRCPLRRPYVASMR